MLQLLAIVLCAWLGWRRDPFLRWPLGVIVAATVGAGAIVVASWPIGPMRDAVLLRSTVSVIAFPLLTYWVAWFFRTWRERRHG
jgi:hypothetical protein